MKCSLLAAALIACAGTAHAQSNNVVVRYCEYGNGGLVHEEVYSAFPKGHGEQDLDYLHASEGGIPAYLITLEAECPSIKG